MFLEDTPKRDRTGWIEVICGSMFSGKTEELIRRLKRAEFAKQKVQIFKPRIDTRYHEEHVVSHDENTIPSTPVTSSTELLALAQNIEVAAIDEAQFFDKDLPAVCAQLACNGIRVIVAGLDTDFKGEPFGPIPELMARAEYVTKVHAICMRCGALANHSHRKTEQEELIVLGETENYEPLCRNCFGKATNTLNQEAEKDKKAQEAHGQRSV